MAERSKRSSEASCDPANIIGIAERCQGSGLRSL